MGKKNETENHDQDFQVDEAEGIYKYQLSKEKHNYTEKRRQTQHISNNNYELVTSTSVGRITCQNKFLIFYTKRIVLLCNCV